MPHVFVIILNYKKWMDVAECLETLLASEHDQYSIFVIDNNSGNDSIQHLVSWCKNDSSIPILRTAFSAKVDKPISYEHVKEEQLPVKLRDSTRLVFVENKRNKGFAGGINTVLQHLLEENGYIWLLNPDMTVETGTLTELVNCGESSGRKTIIGSIIKYYEQPERIHVFGGGQVKSGMGTVRLLTGNNKTDQLDYISGGSLFTHSSTFRELGLLPEKYFLYWEETDFCHRAKLAGYRLSVCENAVCYDKVSSSIGKNYLSDYYYTRNGLLFLSRFKKDKVQSAVFFTIFRLMKRVALGRFSRARGMYKGLHAFLTRSKDDDQ